MLDENLHHLPVRELGLVEQAADAAFVVRGLPVAQGVLCQTEGDISSPSHRGARGRPALSPRETLPTPALTTRGHRTCPPPTLRPPWRRAK